MIDTIVRTDNLTERQWAAKTSGELTQGLSFKQCLDLYCQYLNYLENSERWEWCLDIQNNMWGYTNAGDKKDNNSRVYFHPAEPFEAFVTFELDWFRMRLGSKLDNLLTFGVTVGDIQKLPDTCPVMARDGNGTCLVCERLNDDWDRWTKEYKSGWLQTDRNEYQVSYDNIVSGVSKLRLLFFPVKRKKNGKK